MRFLPALLAVLLAACAATPPTRCAAPQQSRLNELIYFGTATPDGRVTDEQWSTFLREVVTPRFPDGLTTWQAAGQWRGTDGTLVHENSHVLNLVHARDAATERAIGDMIREYKQRFRQEAVLRVQSESCVSF